MTLTDKENKIVISYLQEIIDKIILGDLEVVAVSMNSDVEEVRINPYEYKIFRFLGSTTTFSFRALNKLKPILPDVDVVNNVMEKYDLE